MIREDFAGAGGASLGMCLAGVTDQTTGIELDPVFASTARAAGFERYVSDVRGVRDWDWAILDGYSAGPPCQSFSLAGKGDGRRALAELTRAAGKVADGLLPEEVTPGIIDGAVLALEPLLVIRRHRPRWVMLEQVPSVLPVWETFAAIMRDRWGYSVATGKLHAEQYGVPQSRQRAILVARLDGPVALPMPTHSRYYPRDPQRLDDGVLPWVTMAEALGWNDDDVALRSNYGSGGDSTNRGMRSLDQPAPTVTSKIDRNKWVMCAAGRASMESAGTVPRDPHEAPSATITGQGTAAWVFERPATSVQGDARIGQPGHKHMGNCHPDQPRTRQFDEGSLRVTVAEAAALQTFPANYPWQGTQGQQYQQIGNAVPPLLAAAVIRAAIS